MDTREEFRKQLLRFGELSVAVGYKKGLCIDDAVAAKAEFEGVLALWDELEAALKQRDEDAERLLKDAEMNERALTGFAELWYFVMDEKPLEFETIVTTCAPETWMSEANKLKTKGD